MSCVVLRTHGGLGNQLFQILYGRLFAEKHSCKMFVVHDMNYRHQFPRAMVPLAAMPPSGWKAVISAARIPKFLQRGLRGDEKPWRFLGVWFLDGYFQDENQYLNFDDESIQRQLLCLASELRISPAQNDAHLVHLRLGDFFCNQDSAIRHIIDRLSYIPIGSHIITNEESLLNNPEVKELMAKRCACLVTTIGFSAEDLLRTIAGYRQIDANDSTLIFWAHVLSGSQVSFRSPRLSSLAAKFDRLSPQ